MSKKPVTDWKNWRDVFVSENVRTDLSPGKYRPATLHTWTRERLGRLDRPEPMRLSSFMRIDGNRKRSDVYLDVKLTTQAVETIGNNTIHIDNDTISVKVILWDDERALVVADHNQIIGGVWLAIIDARTIPTWDLVDSRLDCHSMEVK